MKKLLLLALAVSTLGCFGAMEAFAPKAVSPRYYKIGKKAEITLVKNGKAAFEIVAPRNAAPIARFAAQELADFMGRITGAKLKILTAPTGKVPAFIVGDTQAAKAAGIDLAKLDRDGFFIKTFKGNVIIIGNDERSPRALRESFMQRGTLNGVYDFLERFGGVKFYFPGPMGTIVPAKKNWALPSIDIADRPDSQFRQIYCIELKDLNRNKKDYLPESMAKLPVTRMTNLYQRMSTLRIPNCHGLAYLGLVQRFRKSHPEYFALRGDGSRMDGTHITAPSTRNGHLCFTSPVKEVIYQDAAAFLQGKPASSRNILMPNGKVYWNSNFFNRPFFNIMPNDGMFACQCVRCKAIYAKGPQAISELIWNFKIDIAERLAANKIPGYITVMAYAQYKSIPRRAIPSNMIVHLALTGPWKEANPAVQKKDLALLADWYKKLGQKTYLWTYATKCGNAITDIPNFTPYAVGSFFKKSAPHSFGTFFESETDHWLFGAMNFYILGKVLWDSKADVNAIMDEHYALMYGKAAPMLKEIYLSWERHWLKDIMANIRETAVGPQAALPSQFDIWNKIYSPAEIKRIEGLFDKAEKLTVKDKQALARVKFIRKELWGKVLDGRNEFDKANNDRKIWTAAMPETKAAITIDGKLNEKEWKRSTPVHMITRSKKKDIPIEVGTQVRMLCDKDNFYFAFECEEPETSNLLEAKRGFDAMDLWRDNLVELFFSDDRKSEVLYQIMLGSNGCVTDMRWVVNKHDMKWNSKVEYKSGIIPGKKWIAEVRIPRSSMPELKGKKSFMANFTRGRMLKGKNVQPYYVWAPFPKQNPENCGVILLADKVPDNSIILFGDFDRKPYGPKGRERYLGHHKQGLWYGYKKLTIDNKTFRTAGASAVITPGEGLTYFPKFKPSTKYLLSFSVKLENVKPQVAALSGFYACVRLGGAGPARQYFAVPNATMTGTNDWVRLELEFTTPANTGKLSKPYISFNLRKATGKVWIDNVRLVEVK